MGSVLSGASSRKEEGEGEGGWCARVTCKPAHYIWDWKRVGIYHMRLG